MLATDTQSTTAAYVESGGLSLKAAVVTNIYPTPTRPGEGTFVADQVESLRAAGVDIELLHVRRSDAGRGVYRVLARRVGDLVASGAFDVVHVMYGGVMADIVTRTVHDMPVVVSFCGTDLLAGKGRGPLDGLSRRYGAIASRRASRRADGVIVKSSNLIDALPGDIDRSRVWIVPNGIDLDRFRPRAKVECRAELGWDLGRHHVLFPSSPQRPEKRFALARSAIEIARRSGFDIELHVLDCVRHADVSTWLNASDLVLLTSAHEGSPNAVKEALACDLPVVSLDVGDVRSRIAPVNGCHIADPEPEDIACKVVQTLERDRPIAGRRHVTHLALPRVAEQLRAIYATLLGGSRP